MDLVLLVLLVLRRAAGAAERRCWRSAKRL